MAKLDTEHEAVKNLIEYLHDSCKGYEECAEKINDVRLETMFRDISDKRHKMITELEQKAANFAGIEVPESGTIAGPAHRAFIDLKAFLTRGDKDAIINEIKRGDSTLINAYKEAIREERPMREMTDMLNKQLTEIQSELNDIDMVSIH